MHYAYIMPLAHKPQPIALIRAVESLRDFLRREGLSENAFSKRHNLVQSTVHRVLSGRTRTVTPAVRKVLAAANISIEDGITSAPSSAMDNARLREALERAWDGDHESVYLLAALVEAVGTALRSSKRFK